MADFGPRCSPWIAPRPTLPGFTDPRIASRMSSVATGLVVAVENAFNVGLWGGCTVGLLYGTSRVYNKYPQLWGAYLYFNVVVGKNESVSSNLTDMLENIALHFISLILMIPIVLQAMRIIHVRLEAVGTEKRTPMFEPRCVYLLSR